MANNIVITIRFYEGRYHGSGESLPAPARVFRALVAGAARGAVLDDRSRLALQWLESLRPPRIGLPTFKAGQPVQLFVPNNDLDSVGGDPRRIDKIRAIKSVRPLLFTRDVPFIYAWAFSGGERDVSLAEKICEVSDRLFQFGRGVDPAWATGEVLNEQEIDERLSEYRGALHLPAESATTDAATLPCPQPGSLSSLETRFAASLQRLRNEGEGKTTKQLFVQPPKPRFRRVAYDTPSSRSLFELRRSISAQAPTAAGEAAFYVWPFTQATKLVVWLRDEAKHRLCGALPSRTAESEQVLVGRKPDGLDAGPTSGRIRILPLPSIGHPHADHGIRRVLIEVPAESALRAADVHWAFSGLGAVDPDTGEALPLELTATSDTAMLNHHGCDGTPCRTYHTVTPAALPEAKRRRIDPTRRMAEAKGGAERVAENQRACAAVIQALRHADVRARVASIRVQREPFGAKGERAEAFAFGKCFPKERLWHVEIEFTEPVAGPLVIGDGRFLGLGLMKPGRRSHGAHAFSIESGLVGKPDATQLARALRRAVIARVQEQLGRRRKLPAFFSAVTRKTALWRSPSAIPI